MANNNHFELTLDTLAPTGTIEGLGDYEKINKASKKQPKSPSLERSFM